MEEFEKRSETETYGEETPAATSEVTPESQRDEAGRYSGTDTPEKISETEEESAD